MDGSTTLYSFHKQMRADMEFPQDQLIMFKALSADGNVVDDGLEIIRNLIPQAQAHLAPRGSILMETGEYNAEATAALAEGMGFNTEIHRDLEGQLRVVEAWIATSLRSSQ